MTITHKYGETTIESAPQRVVCIGYTEQDALLALGIVPVGVTYWFGDKSLQGVCPWARDLLGDVDPPVLLEDADGVEIEKVAALAPDLIIGQYTGLKESDYELLSALAPVVAQSGEYADYGMPWDEMTINVGAAVITPWEGPFLYGPEDPRSRMLVDLGFTLHPLFTDADGSYYVAHSFVTALSIPYLLDRYVPQLAAAADGDPTTKPPAAKA